MHSKEDRRDLGLRFLVNGGPWRVEVWRFTAGRSGASAVTTESKDLVKSSKLCVQLSALWFATPPPSLLCPGTYRLHLGVGSASRRHWKETCLGGGGVSGYFLSPSVSQGVYLFLPSLSAPTKQPQYDSNSHQTHAPVISNSCGLDVVGAFLLPVSWYLISSVWLSALPSPLKPVLAFKSLSFNTLSVAAVFLVGPWYLCYLWPSISPVGYRNPEELSPIREDMYEDICHSTVSSIGELGAMRVSISVMQMVRMDE